MGGLVARVAVGSGAIHPSWIDSMIYIGSPLKGAPVAFRAAYDRMTLPFINEFTRLLRWRNTALFIQHLYACFRTFPSLYQLMPHEGHPYIGYTASELWNPLSDDVVPREFRSAAHECQSMLAVGSRTLVAAQTRVLSICTHVNATHPTDLFYRVEEVTGEHPAYRILETLGTTVQGDGTVPRESAATGTTYHVQNVDHAYLCNNKHVADILKTIMG
jgi:hypothetical protein